jgi:hypothetical protein
VSRSGNSIKSVREFIEVDVVRICLRRVRTGVAHQPLQSNEVAATLTEEAISKAVAKLMRREALDTSALADAPDHPHQRLRAGRLLRILLPAHALVLRHPLLYVDSKDVIV